jgi:hypothetical protein
MTRLIRNPWSLSIVVAATLAITAAILTAGSHIASAADPSYSVLQQPTGAGFPTTDAAYQQLQTENPNLDLAAAHQVLADANGTLWLVPSTNGNICLVEQPTAAGAHVPGHPDLTLGTGFSCTSTAQANTAGVFIGVPGPGRWDYGVAPDGVTQVEATVNSQTVAVPLTNHGFQVPPTATSVTVGTSAPVALTQLPAAP